MSAARHGYFLPYNAGNALSLKPRIRDVTFNAIYVTSANQKSNRIYPLNG